MTSSPHRYAEVKVALQEVVDWPSFHSVFKRLMGFPDFYGANMNAWIDCMSSLDAPEDGTSVMHAPRDGVLVLALGSVSDFKKRCPEIFDALVGSAAFVNWRRLEQGGPPVIALSYYE
jgi:hypothetical protein